MGSFSEWFFDPLIKIIRGDNEQDTDEYNIIKEIIPKIETVDTVNKLFRPSDFSQYVGQDRAKSILKDYIQATKERQRVFPHTIISGKAGCGKTTLAKIIANNLDVNFTELITSELQTPLDLLLKIAKIDGGIVFLDEIHAIERNIAESIYTVMEDFEHETVAIKPFTLIGATTELGEILKTRRPFYDRFKLPIELENYTSQNVATIAKQYKERTFPHDIISDEDYLLIGANSRNTPRTAIRLTEATVYLKNLKKVLYNFGIIKDGFTEKDLKILKYIKRNDKGVGLQGLVSYLGTSTENYMQDIEPYILQKDLIVRTPRGRKITDEGIKKIEELENA